MTVLKAKAIEPIAPMALKVPVAVVSWMPKSRAGVFMPGYHHSCQTHRHTDTQTHRHTQAHTQAHTHTGTHTHRLTHTQAHTHTGTHTHTHADMLITSVTQQMSLVQSRSVPLAIIIMTWCSDYRGTTHFGDYRKLLSMLQQAAWNHMHHCEWIF